MMKHIDSAKAFDAYIARKAEFDAMLARLRELSADHFNWSPDEITWGHVGTLGHYAEMLERITDSAFHEGEHAEYPHRPVRRHAGGAWGGTGAGRSRAAFRREPPCRCPIPKPSFCPLPAPAKVVFCCPSPPP
ncbi:hypothetical protein [Magnetospirillum sp. SS-4]|uniref:hypothetical protein n=1 Tax=Magnetospirillum sp. SS-4 TaxID=2681465 RepID=UPI0020C57C48|nr:hypothetical protein [Magnetospirillum sp. SS-4]